MKRNSKGDVRWFLPLRKKPVAYSTVATKDWILQLAQLGGTVQDIYDSLDRDYISNPEAKTVLAEYVKRGYGNKIARHLFY